MSNDTIAQPANDGKTQAVSLDLEMLSRIAGFGDGYHSSQTHWIASNAFSSLARRLEVAVGAAQAEYDIAEVVRCEAQRCRALATLLSQLGRTPAQASYAAAQGARTPPPDCGGAADGINERANAAQGQLAELGDAMEVTGIALSDVATATDVQAMEDAAREAKNHAQAAIAQATEVLGVAGRILGLCEAERIAAHAGKTRAAVAGGER
ncbi:MAG TPA: hypothetical protein PKD61_34235 [Polyangiaceae bacterium]|nr:hypothetical protein [Polyangiaceae bacterium]